MLLRQIYRTSIDDYIRKHKLSCGLQSSANAIASSRVKRRVSAQPHVKARLCDSVEPERGANMGDNGMKFTAFTRQGEI